DSAAHRMRGLDPDAVVARAIVLERAQSGPRQNIAPRHDERIDIAVGACGGLADDIGQVIGLDDSHHRRGLLMAAPPVMKMRRPFSRGPPGGTTQRSGVSYSAGPWRSGLVTIGICQIGDCRG